MRVKVEALLRRLYPSPTVWYRYIQDNNGKCFPLIPGLPVKSTSLFAIGAGCNRITQTCQQFSCNISNYLLVVHDKNRNVVLINPGLLPCLFTIRLFFGRRWKHYGDNRSLADFRSYVNVTTMLADNGVGCAQAEACAAVLCGEVGVVNLIQIIFLYAAAAVLKDNFHIVSRLQRIPVLFIHRDAVNVN